MMHQYDALGEQLFRTTLSNGLTVAVNKRPGFQRKLAYFVTDFGSVHTDFVWNGTEYHAPAGIAHFLEHKMFELPGRDVSAEFAALGANVNAFTSYDMTAYYFHCTQHFAENLRLLLEFVSTPYFEAESVQREIGIIDQEIGMNADAPDAQVFEMLMQQMYRRHPIRLPILGTGQSIREITPELLYTVHQAFYTPANMILCVVGDVDEQQVCRLAEEVLGTHRRPVGRKIRNWDEEMTAGQDVGREMEVSMPAFQLGFKCEYSGKGEQAIRQEIVGDLAAEALFGESSRLYLQLYEQGLIDSSFGGGFETVDGCALLTCGGDSENAPAIRQAIWEQARQLIHNGIGQADFLRMKRSAMGRRIRDLDSFDATAFRICAYHLSDFDYFAFPAVYAAVEEPEILEFLQRTVTPERCALAVICPLSENTTGGTTQC